MQRIIGLFGLFVILALAWLMSENRRRMNWRLIVSGLLLQFGIAVVLLKTAVGQQLFDSFQSFTEQILGFSDRGAEFIFGTGFREHYFAFSVLPTIIFVASATAVLFHLGIIQWVVKGMAWVMLRAMNVSGTESLAAAAEVFVGMTESPLLIRPYLDTMTRSEIMAMMTAGMGTVAGGVLAVYVAMGVPAGHLLAASLMAAPASLVVAKIMVPETEDSPTKGTVRIEVPRTDRNVLDAACRGAGDGLKLALNVGAMIIALIGLVACVNTVLGLLGDWGGAPLSLERVFGWLFAPLAWSLGVEWSEARTVGMLMGKKTILNEMLAYQDLVALADQLSARTRVIATFALCGFANLGSVAVQIGGISGLAPERRPIFAQYGLKAMIGGTLATFMTAAIAGILVD